MSMILAITAAVAAALLGYLVYVLVKGEDL